LNIQSIQKNDKGFTGLEAAIVLIAFIIVAAVFSFGILGTGFVTAQKSEDVVHYSTIQTSSSLLTSGDVIVKSTANGVAGNIVFYLTDAAGGTPIDLNKTVITYTDEDISKSRDYGTGTNGWTYTAKIYASGHNDNYLEPDEKYRIDMDLNTFEVSPLPVDKERVKLEIKPPGGAVSVIQFKMPDALVQDNYYVVY